jgi:outer membrane biosynthesis protein TonB
VLKTLDKYLDDQEAVGGFSHTIRAWYSRERRFARLLVISAVAHVIFFGVILRIDTLSQRYRTTARAQETVLIKVAELAPPPERLADLRAPSEPLERVDTSRLEYDPERADDVHLTARSPRPIPTRGSGNRLPSSEQLERQLRYARARALRAGSNAAASATTAPPVSPTINMSRQPRLDAPTVALGVPPKNEPAPPEPLPRQTASLPAPKDQQPPQTEALGGDGSPQAALGLQQVQAQYMAYVRARIRDANERNMPRDWIKDMLTAKVSADFKLILRRGGYIQSVDLLRSSGFRVLDGKAREAIYIAGPFQGWPHDAGDTIILTVTVHYTPLW